MKEFLRDILRQVFGLTKPRTGNIVLSRHAFKKMEEYGMDYNTILDSFRYGEGITPTMIIHKYVNYKVGMYYKQDGISPNGKHMYLILTVWKQEDW